MLKDGLLIKTSCFMDCQHHMMSTCFQQFFENKIECPSAAQRSRWNAWHDMRSQWEITNAYLQELLWILCNTL